jgi:hypothetical protein
MKPPKYITLTTPIARPEGIPYRNELDIPMTIPKGIPATKNSFTYIFIFQVLDLASNFCVYGFQI